MDTSFLIVFFVIFTTIALAMLYVRFKFRKLLHRPDAWPLKINPVLGKELTGLYKNVLPNNKQYKIFRALYLTSLGFLLLLFSLFFGWNTKPKSENSIGVGSMVPSFELYDQNGTLFILDSLLGKKNLVIYFYPQDDSPGCTAEACKFRDQYEIFEKEDAVVIGISSQSVESHLAFAQKHLLKYTLLSDRYDKVRDLFGVPSNLFGMLPGRVTYVVNMEGKVIYMLNAQMQAEKHVADALHALQNQ